VLGESKSTNFNLLCSPTFLNLTNSNNLLSDIQVGYLTGTACSNVYPQHGILPIPKEKIQSLDDKGDENPRETEVALSPIRGKEDNRDPQALLERLNFQLVDKYGKEIKVTVSPQVYERKKRRAQKELNRLASNINYGGGKGGKGQNGEI